MNVSRVGSSNLKQPNQEVEGGLKIQIFDLFCPTRQSLATCGHLYLIKIKLKIKFLSALATLQVLKGHLCLADIILGQHILRNISIMAEFYGTVMLQTQAALDLCLNILRHETCNSIIKYILFLQSTVREFFLTFKSRLCNIHQKLYKFHLQFSLQVNLCRANLIAFKKFCPSPTQKTLNPLLPHKYTPFLSNGSFYQPHGVMLIYPPVH